LLLFYSTEGEREKGGEKKKKKGSVRRGLGDQIVIEGRRWGHQCTGLLHDAVGREQRGEKKKKKRGRNKEVYTQYAS